MKQLKALRKFIFKTKPPHLLVIPWHTGYAILPWHTGYAASCGILVRPPSVAYWLCRPPVAYLLGHPRGILVMPLLVAYWLPGLWQYAVKTINTTKNINDMNQQRIECSKHNYRILHYILVYFIYILPGIYSF